jgi:hypothetical protein
MWMCRAVLADGKVCETTNFDTAEQCVNCAAPRQANDAYATHDELDTLIDTAKHAAEIGREKLKQYAPVATAVAQTAKDRAGTLAMHSRLATHTGLHMAGVLSFCLALLVASVILPVALGWPLTLTVTQRTDSKLVVGADSLPPSTQSPTPVPSIDQSNQAAGGETANAAPASGLASQPNQLPGATPDQDPAGLDNTGQPQEIMGSLAESRHVYQGSEREITFIPKKVTDPRRTQLQWMSLLAGPIIVSGTAVTLNGRGSTADGTGKGSISLQLSNGRIFWFSALALLLLLFLADVFIPDIYAMHKFLFSLQVTWILYSLLLGWLASSYMKGFVHQLFPDVSMDMTVSGLMTAPVKIGFIGLIYWMTSMIVRSLHEERTAQKAERRRLAAEADA